MEVEALAADDVADETADVVDDADKECDLAGQHGDGCNQ